MRNAAGRPGSCGCRVDATSVMCCPASTRASPAAAAASASASLRAAAAALAAASMLVTIWGLTGDDAAAVLCV